MLLSRVLPLCSAFALVSNSAIGQGPPPTFTGPVPYSGVTDSPFFGSGTICYALEDFQTGSISTNGLSMGTTEIILPGAGVPDPGPEQFVAEANNFGVIQFDFSLATLGSYPTQVGIVWTGGPNGSGSVITLAVIDSSGTMFVSQAFDNLPDNTTSLDDNLFFGVTWSQGISQLRIQFNPNVDQQIDHVQFSLPTADTDSDGTPDCFDGCPEDPVKTDPGVCGCGIDETDSDSDGVPDCSDPCPNDPTDLCNPVRGDVNRDGIPDCLVHDQQTRLVSAWILDSNAGIQTEAPIDLVPEGWWVAGLADFTGDGIRDLLVQNVTTREILVHELGGLNGSQVIGTLNITRQNGQILQLPTGYTLQYTCDFDGDGDPDILLRRTDGFIAAWQMNGTVFEQVRYLVNGTTSTRWRVRGAIELDEPGTSWILFQHLDSGKLVRWNMSGFLRQSSSEFIRADNGQALASCCGWLAAGLRKFPGDSAPSIIAQNSDGRVLRWKFDDQLRWIGFEFITDNNPQSLRVVAD